MRILLSFVHGTPVSLNSMGGLSLVLCLSLVTCWGLIFKRWQRGLYLLMVTTPFMGAISLYLFPLEWPKLLKDILFVIPCYLSFLYGMKGWRNRTHIPRPVLGALGILSFLVLLQSFNPSVENWVMAAIGIKVWLFYIPLLFIAHDLINDKKDLIDLFRALLVMACCPVVVGFIQFLGDHIIGHVETMEYFYGAAGYQAAYYYGEFELGRGYIYRVQSTFTFSSQYFYYLLIILMLAYVSYNMDTQGRWKRFAAAMFWLVTLAAYLTGIRAAFVLIPFLSGLMILWSEGVKRALQAVTLSTLILFSSLTFPGIIHGMCKMGRSVTAAKPTPLAVVRPASVPTAKPAPTAIEKPIHAQAVSIRAWAVMMGELIVGDPKVIGYDCIKSALEKAPWGMGTGMNTGPARLTYSDPTKFQRYENYYAKAIYELGVPGLLTLLFLYGSILFYGIRVIRSLEHKDLRIFAIGIISLMLVCFLLSFKAWMLDQDPLNYFFWILTGFLFKLPLLEGHNSNRLNTPR